MPTNAETFTRNDVPYALWTVKGKVRTAPVNDAGRIVTEGGTWYAKYRCANGEAMEVSTGCKEKGAAQSRVSAMVAEQERIRAGIVTASETKTAKHGQKPYADTVTGFIDSMTARGCSKDCAKEWKALLLADGVDMTWRTLRDMDRARLEQHLTMRATTPKDPKKPESTMGARRHNVHVTAFTAFGAWCARQGYVKANPFTGTVKRDERADRRHIRRALTPDELLRLFEAAQTRPLREAYKGNRGRGKAQKNDKAKLSDSTIDAMHLLGMTRAMAYKTAALTGMRWNELRSITLGAVRLDTNPPHFILEARNEKARRGAQIAFPAGLAHELRDCA
jgi:hypothetical protein